MEYDDGISDEFSRLGGRYDSLTDEALSDH